VLPQHYFVGDVRFRVPAPITGEAARLADGRHQASAAGKDLEAAVGVVAIGVLAPPASAEKDRVPVVDDVIGLEGFIMLPFALRSAEVVSGGVEAIADEEVVGQRRGRD